MCLLHFINILPTLPFRFNNFNYMKKTVLLIVLITLLVPVSLVAQQDNRNNRNAGANSQEPAPVFNFKVVPVNLTGSAENRVTVGYAGDGYTAADLSTLPGHVKTAVDYLATDILPTRPYARYYRFLNIYRIDLVSEESGISRASKFGDSLSVKVKNSIGGTRDDDRLGWVDGRLADQMFGQAATSAGLDQFDWKYAVLNNSAYHNSGGRHVVFSYNYGREIALHEAGHGFHQLADEYYGRGVYTRQEPRQVNVTADSTGAKWAHWMGYVDADTLLGTVGVYEGAIYVDKGAYRPTPNSKMGWTSDRKPASFNAICREKVILDIYELVRPADSFADTTVTHTNPDKLWVKVIDSDVIKVDWYVNGKLVAENGGESLSADKIGKKAGSYTVKAHLYDEVVKYAFSDNKKPHPLDLVRRDLDKLQQDITWNVVVKKPGRK